MCWQRYWSCWRYWHCYWRETLYLHLQQGQYKDIWAIFHRPSKQLEYTFIAWWFWQMKQYFNQIQRFPRNRDRKKRLFAHTFFDRACCASKMKFSFPEPLHQETCKIWLCWFCTTCLANTEGVCPSKNIFLDNYKLKLL